MRVTHSPSTKRLTLPIGFYPIVSHPSWVATLMALGVRTIQLRCKALDTYTTERYVAKSVAIANQYNGRLFINDHWSFAIRYNAFGVHLGQTDLSPSAIDHIHRSGLYLGISTHSKQEIDAALPYRPDYIAFGTIYHTRSKQMSHPPQGIARLRKVTADCPCPVIAIGGIDLNNVETVMNAGVKGVSVISAIQQSTQLKQDVQTFLALTGDKPC